MKTTKTSTLFLAVAAVLALGVAAVYAQGPVNVKMTFSGASTDNSIINIQPNSSEDEDNFAGTGTLGSFTLRNVRAISNNLSSTTTCDLYLTELAGAGVLRLQDGSLLYLQMKEGSDCINLTTGVAKCTLTFQIAGGTGRFQNASSPPDTTLTFTETVVTLMSDYLGNPISLAATGELTGPISGVSGEQGQGGGY